MFNDMPNEMFIIIAFGTKRSRTNTKSLILRIQCIIILITYKYNKYNKYNNYIIIQMSFLSVNINFK